MEQIPRWSRSGGPIYVRAMAGHRQYLVREMLLHRAERRVYDGEARVARQREIVAELRADDLPYKLAEDLLGVFQATLLLHRSHLERLLREQDAQDSES
ncbi:MAG TPA: hypothetical protein VD994_22205 [Prosthecobacter sp.]|nr:hypothetical protein [Prosthecobacter sp.]